MRVLVVVLNWNGIDDTEECLDGLAVQTHPADVLVVDNGSSPDDVRRLRARAESGAIRLRLEPENLGFAGGVNVGIRLAQHDDYDAVALLNNDALPEPGWLATLVAALEADAEAAIATGLLLRRSDDPAIAGTIDTAGDGLSVWGMPFPRGRSDGRAHAPEKGRVFSASGGASLYRTALFDEIGLFDETFFAYFEDIDIGFRARLAGHEIVYEPAAVAHHRIGATSGRIPGFTVRQTFKNLPVLLVKDVPAGLRHVIWPRFALLFAMMLGKTFATGSGAHALRGIGGAIRLLPHALRERRRIQGARSATAADIDALLLHDLPPEQHGMRKLLRVFRR
ncbi:glycosyltransferase family 2 protein [Microbacterium sp. JZ37]|uniref:glycosyltransferase family 2 protein n=1 Tax=Microbacterium sp. JZ37 TaxID=2654193 RepID=UPI002B4A9FB0|nr:glycosyltransferase family 2 protein [Microbacterium sp. JZ37]